MVNLTQGQMNVLLKSADDRCSFVRELIKKEASTDVSSIDIGVITVLTAEYNNLQTAMMQLTMAGAIVQ